MSDQLLTAIRAEITALEDRLLQLHEIEGQILTLRQHPLPAEEPQLEGRPRRARAPVATPSATSAEGVGAPAREGATRRRETEQARRPHLPTHRLYGGRVLALTGTPMPHSPLDLYAQFRALDETLLGTSNSAFRARYGQPKVLRYTDHGDPVYVRGPAGQPVYDGVRADRRPELIGRVAPLMFQVAAGGGDARRARGAGVHRPRHRGARGGAAVTLSRGGSERCGCG